MECGAIPALLSLAARWRIGAHASAGRPGGAPNAAAASTAVPAVLGAAEAAREASTMLLRLLDAASQVRANRAALLDAGALELLEEQAQAAFASPRQAPAAEALLLVLERLINEAPATGAARGSSGDLMSAVTNGAAAAARARAFWRQLCKLCATPPAASGAPPRGAATVARVAARVAATAPDAAAALAAEVAPHLSRAAAALDDAASDDAAALRAAALLLAVPAPPQANDGLRARLLEGGAIAALRRWLLSTAFPAGCAREKGSPEFTAAAARPAVPLALTLLAGVVRGHAAAAEAAAAAEPEDSGLLPLLHVLESAASGGVGTAAEEALATLAAAGAPAVASAVGALRAASKEETRRKALAWREAMLRDMGMTRLSGGGGSVPTSAFGIGSAPGGGGAMASTPPSVSAGSWGGGDRIVAAASPGSFGAMLDDDSDDEEGDAGAGGCAVCREGYRLRPGEPLGVYVFTKRVPLAPAAAALAAAVAPAPQQAQGAGNSALSAQRGAAESLAALLGVPAAALIGAGTAGASGSGASGSSSSSSGPASHAWGFATVSHFNAIHVSCHAAARRADAALKTPKREWDGAATRNHGTRCNALLPLRGGAAVPDGAYAAACDAYWAALSAVADGGDDGVRESRAAAAALQRTPGVSSAETHAARARTAAHDLALLLRCVCFGLRALERPRPVCA